MPLLPLPPGPFRPLSIGIPLRVIPPPKTTWLHSLKNLLAASPPILLLGAEIKAWLGTLRYRVKTADILSPNVEGTQIENLQLCEVFRGYTFPLRRQMAPAPRVPLQISVGRFPKLVDAVQ